MGGASATTSVLTIGFTGGVSGMVSVAINFSVWAEKGQKVRGQSKYNCQGSWRAQYTVNFTLVPSPLSFTEGVSFIEGA